MGKAEIVPREHPSRTIRIVRTGLTISDFEVSADGREIIFDRSREESDIVLFDLPDR